MNHIQKFYLILGVSVLTLAGIFVWQAKKSFNINITQNETPLVSKQVYNISIAEEEAVRGNPGANITLVEYLDLNCSDCVEKYKELNKLVDKNPSKLRLVLKIADTSGLFAHNSQYVNTAAYCANQQERYWSFLDSLMNKEKRWSEETILSAANEAKINIETWNKCRESEKAIAAVNLSLQLAKELGIETSPTIFVNNQKIDPQTKISLTEIINKFIQ